MDEQGIWEKLEGVAEMNEVDDWKMRIDLFIDELICDGDIAYKSTIYLLKYMLKKAKETLSNMD